MNKSLIAAFAPSIAAIVFAGACVSVGYGQTVTTGAGGTPTMSFGGSTGPTGGTGPGGGTGSNSLFQSSGGSGSGTSGSSSSLFPGSSSSTSSSYGSSTGSTGSMGSSGSSSSTGGVQSTTLSAGNTPIQRGNAINRDTGSTINSNYDVIGGQAGSTNNQFASLISQMGRQMNQGGNFNQQGGRNAARPSIRIPLRLGFVAKPISAPVFSARFEGRISKLSGLSATAPIKITMDGSTAVLTGEVASAQDRELAAGVALLEPEVESVRNELTVRDLSPSDLLNSPTTTP
jgi:hypothetical protein